MAAASPFSSAPVQEGEVLAAKYRVEKVIGVGGMGIVVSAMHLELGRRVALKFLLPQAQTSDEMIGRFMREAKASLKLKGRHVAKTLDVGRMDDGRAYIVMEYLEGKDLGAEIKAAAGGPFAINEAVGWMLQACEGLAEAHALGIVHRDLKPANLFLAHGEGAPVVKLLDFGISKSINPSSSDILSLTKTEMLLGSPLYMAPEQMRSSKYVDERSDIWALGAISYELLTGHVPFEADTLLDLCFKVAQETCLPAHEHRAEIPKDLSDVVMRCLEKDADRRWNDIGELAAALEPFARESDRGSASRTVAVLASGSRPPRAPRASESKVITSGKRAVIHADEQVTTGGAETSRAPFDGDVSPDTIPASSAWGATSSQPQPARKSWKGPLAIGALAILVAVVSFAVARGTTPQQPPDRAVPESLTPPPPSTTPATAIAAPPPVIPSESATAASSVPAAPIVQTPVPKPKPKPPASESASAAPADSSGFIKVRE